ncbi:SBBP repeat-containing protein [Sorangium sp. So ce363]|uniref:SBBP repeat-containing protein n=1 Tax=Sorangium sp. So ce363 TaxID=3133304 RepID=UPI003F5D647C
MRMRTSLRWLAGIGILVVSGCGLVLGLEDFEDAAPADNTAPEGTGGGSTCEPESVAKCYSGPPGTKDVGICEAGTQACKQDGSGYEACEGEVTPAAETCASTDDEDCDGKDCVRWARLIGGAEEEDVTGVATDSAGNVYVGGKFTGAMSFGDDVLIAAGGNDAFLAKFSASGEYVWSRQVGDVKGDTVYALAVNSQGEVMVTSLELESQLASMNMVLHKYDPDGRLLWRKPLGGKICGLVPSAVRGMTFLPDGDVVLVGDFCGTIRFDDEHVVSNETDSEEIFVAKLRSSDGSVDDESGWVRVWGGEDAQIAQRVIVDAAGNIILAGHFYDELVLGDLSYASAGGADVFLAKLTSRGLVSWARVVGGTDHETLQTIAVDRLGGPALVIGFQGTVDFGGGEVVVNERASALLKYTTSNVYEWARVFDGALTIGAILAESASDVMIVGGLVGTVELGGDLLRAKSERDLVLAKVGPEGEPLWTRTFGLMGEDGVSATASVLSGRGELLIAGAADGRIDFGAGVMTPQGDGDVFVASFSP